MPTRLPRLRIFTPLLLLVTAILVPDAQCAPRYRVLHAFTGGSDGGTLLGSLLLDIHSNVYGTTYYGGANDGGTAFELIPNAVGEWKLANLYNFCSEYECWDGNASFAGVILGDTASLYGTTALGGTDEYGTIFRLTPRGDGTWSETVLHSFTKDDDGGSPRTSLAIDPSGNLYGAGETWGFELSTGASGWTLKGLHEFTGEGGDGGGALSAVIRDSLGNLYGVTEQGGDDQRCGGGCGITYELSPEQDGKWKETILHTFDVKPGDGAFPTGTLFQDLSRNIYGTTKGNNAGTVYRLSPEKSGQWRETILHRFTAGKGGNDPGTGVVMGKSGELYGVTYAGGDPNCYCGVVFKLAAVKGKWQYSVLHRFVGSDGANPGASLIIDGKGNLYGTTELGGRGGYGVAFELTP